MQRCYHVPLLPHNFLVERRKEKCALRLTIMCFLVSNYSRKRARVHLSNRIAKWRHSIVIKRKFSSKLMKEKIIERLIWKNNGQSDNYSSILLSFETKKDLRFENVKSYKRNFGNKENLLIFISHKLFFA